LKNLKFLIKSFGLILLGIFIVIISVQAEHHVYLQVPNSVPSYCQETNIWCGAACAQMILEGYPGGVEHPFTQTHIWNRIQAHLDDPGVNWATDPDGLRDTLMELGGDPGVYWSIYANSNAQSLMYTVAYWMTRRLFPVATLVYGFQHWVVIVGVTTDVDPRLQSSVSLQFIEIIDPWNPPCPTAISGGVKSWMSGSNWYSNYWYTPGNIAASKWNGNYLAIVEPPVKEGLAKAPKQVEQGRVISESEAVEMAMSWIKKLNIYKREPYTLLSKTKPLKPFLTNAKYKGYYLVPLGYEEGMISQGAVLINAYNGDFQEVGIFQRPIKYLTEELAVKIALNYLCACKDRDIRQARAMLIFEPSEQSKSRFLPIWQITVEQMTVYVTMEGKVFEKLTILPLGD